MSYLIATQHGPVQVEIGARYRVVVRSIAFGDDAYEGTLDAVQRLDPNPTPEALGGHPLGYRAFDFLHFKPTSRDRWPGDGRGARDFTIARLTRIAGAP
jgi:hypothetical protein